MSQAKRLCRPYLDKSPSRRDQLRIAVAGGTGTLGRFVVTDLSSRGHEVRVLSRSSEEHPVDLTTGTGLDNALEGCAVVVDVVNDDSKHAAATLVDGAQRLLAAEHDAGVGHHVCVSIVGCERLPIGYFAAKAEQERVVVKGPMPWSIVRATQFHQLVNDALTRAARWRLLPLPRAKLQPVAAEEVAKAVTDVAEGAPLHDRIQIAGPQMCDARRLARSWASITGRHLVLAPVPFPGKTGRALRSGVLTAEHPDIHASLSFAGWLAANHQL